MDSEDAVGRPPYDDRGQALPLLLVVVGVALLALMVLSHLTTAVDDAARARTAADAAALAGALEGRGAASRLAEANGGALMSYSDDGSAVTVLVRVGGAEARAKADRTVDWVGSIGAISVDVTDSQAASRRDLTAVVPQWTRGPQVS